MDLMICDSLKSERHSRGCFSRRVTRSWMRIREGVQRLGSVAVHSIVSQCYSYSIKMTFLASMGWIRSVKGLGLTR